jgi:hypothetical protein
LSYQSEGHVNLAGRMKGQQQRKTSSSHIG